MVYTPSKVVEGVEYQLEVKVKEVTGLEKEAVLAEAIKWVTEEREQKEQEQHEMVE